MKIVPDYLRESYLNNIERNKNIGIIRHIPLKRSNMMTKKNVTKASKMSYSER